MTSDIVLAHTVDLKPFRALLFDSSPPRLESAVIFDVAHITQKLIFHLMDISWKHGFGCSAPQFGTPEDENLVVFSIGAVLPSTSSRSIRAWTSRLKSCLLEIREFAMEFAAQLDFSKLDVSMFQNISFEDFDPQFMASLRDQQYSGSWDVFFKDMVRLGRMDEAAVVQNCAEFEKVNKKDMGLVGAKLRYELSMMGDERSDAPGEN